MRRREYWKISCHQTPFADGKPSNAGSLPVRVCTKTLYNYIAAGLLKVKNIDLLLRVKRKPTKHHGNRENKRLYGESIENRPVHIEERQEAGIGRLIPLWAKRKRRRFS